MDDGSVEARHLGEVGIGVKRVLVAAQPVQQRLLRQGRRLDDAVGFPLRRHVADLRARGASEAALSADEEARAGREERLAGLVAALVLGDHESGLPLVEDVGHAPPAERLRGGGKRLVDLDVLLAVQELGHVELDSREIEAATAADDRAPAPSGHHHEARQDLQVLLVGVLELARVGGRHARPDAQVVEDHVVDLPA